MRAREREREKQRNRERENDKPRIEIDREIIIFETASEAWKCGMKGELGRGTRKI